MASACDSANSAASCTATSKSETQYYAPTCHGSDSTVSFGSAASAGSDCNSSGCADGDSNPSCGRVNSCDSIGLLTTVSQAADAPNGISRECTREGSAPLPITTLNHVSIHCADVAKSVEFYVDVMGFFPVKRPHSLRFEGAW